MSATDREIAEVEAWLTAVADDLGMDPGGVDMSAGERGRWSVVRMPDPGWCRVRRGRREWTWALRGPDDDLGFAIVRADLVGERRETIRRRAPQDRDAGQMPSAFGVDATFAAIARFHGFDPIDAYLTGSSLDETRTPRMLDAARRPRVQLEDARLHQGVVAGTIHAFGPEGENRLRYQRVDGMPLLRIDHVVLPASALHAVPGLALSQVVGMEELEGLEDVTVVHAEESSTATGDPSVQMRLMPVIRWPRPETHPTDHVIRAVRSDLRFR